MRQYLNDKGYALVLVLLFVTIISLTMAGLSLKMTNDLKQTDKEQDSQGAYYVAEGGVADVMQMISDRIEDIAESQKSASGFYNQFEKEFIKTQKVDGFSKNNGESPFAYVTISKAVGSPQGQYQIESIGEIGSRKRTVAGAFKIEFKEGSGGITLPPGMGIYAKQKIDLNNNAVINGDAILSGNISGGLSMGNNSEINGTAYVQSDKVVDRGNKAKVQKVIVGNLSVPDYQLPVFPAKPNIPATKNLTISGNKTELINGDLAGYNNVKLENNAVLTFNTGNQDTTIVMNDLDISNSGVLKINGTGKVSIYLTGGLSLNNNSVIEGKQTKNLTIYIGPSGRKNNPREIKFGNNSIVTASLYASDANIEFSNNASIVGVVVTGGKSVRFSNNSTADSQDQSTLIYAPKAVVEVNNNAVLYGSIVSLKTTLGNNAVITAKKVNTEDNPIFSGGNNAPAHAEISSPNIKEK
ncbi:pilus assembly PilX N-terminal domain-containing protein [Bhargavaea ullalensis]|uniref:DUF7305 domain-containing protein n=1 Tax=Bhargavaea ullalensis TaxID=1265685 RepID=A0ABV2G8M5_9BACL